MCRILKPQLSLIWSAGLLFVFVCCVALSTRAQTAEEQIAKFSPSMTPDLAAVRASLLRGYEAYAKRDATALFSLFSQHSPYLPAFQQLMREDFATNESAKIAGLSAKLTRNVELDGDKAKARLYVQIHAVDKVTGKTAEGFGDMDHTFYFVRENGVWKIWQFLSTAEELVPELLAAKSDEERATLLKASEPFTDGLLKGLVDQAQNVLEARGDDARATMLFNIVLVMSRKANSRFGGPHRPLIRAANPLRSKLQRPA